MVADKRAIEAMTASYLGDNLLINVTDRKVVIAVTVNDKTDLDRGRSLVELSGVDACLQPPREMRGKVLDITERNRFC